jgi:hypothetical protein
MSRYVVGRPRSEEFWDRPMQPMGHPTVFCPEPADTGLLDGDGNPILRLPDPIGFLAK